MDDERSEATVVRAEGEALRVKGKLAEALVKARGEGEKRREAERRLEDEIAASAGARNMMINRQASPRGLVIACCGKGR